MSPVNKYSLILMHDDGHTRRLRVRAGVFRLLGALLVILAVGGGAGIWVGWQSWQSRQSWEKDKYELERELAECKVRLERLSNMQALYENSRTVVSVSPPGAAAQATSAAGSESSPASAETTASNAAGTDAAEAPETSTGDSTVPPSGNGTLPAENLGTAASNAEELITVDSGMVRVENAVARLDDRRRLRVSVDLYNGDSTGQQISGKVVFTLLDADSQEYPISADNMLFRIVRFKKMVVSTDLPTGVADAENAAVRVEVFVDNKLEFRRIYPVESR